MWNGPLDSTAMRRAGTVPGGGDGCAPKSSRRRPLSLFGVAQAEELAVEPRDLGGQRAILDAERAPRRSPTSRPRGHPSARDVTRSTNGETAARSQPSPTVRPPGRRT